MLEEIIVSGLVLFLLIFLAGFLVVCWLWKRKSSSDRKAYCDVLNQKEVDTFYSPEDYAEATKKKEP